MTQRAWLKRLRPVLSTLLSAAIVGAIFFYFLPKFTDMSSVWTAIRDLTPVEIAVLALAAIWNLCTYWLVMVATMPGLTYPQAAVVTESTTAVSNTVPGGGAIGIGMSYAMYSSWGFSRSRSSVSLLVSGLWNNFAKLAMPVLALAIVALQAARPAAGWSPASSASRVWPPRSRCSR